MALSYWGGARLRLGNPRTRARPDPTFLWGKFNSNRQPAVLHAESLHLKERIGRLRTDRGQPH
jgi:hypothetical protein